MQYTIISLIALFISFNPAYSKSNPLGVGVVTGIKGNVFKLVPTVGIKRKKVILKEGMKVFEADIIATEKNAFVELEMIDHTTLTLAPSSSFEIKKFRYTPGKERVTHYHQSWGALRAKVKRPTTNNESIQFNTKHVAVGVNDSEFLSNSYSVNNRPTNDLLLLKGKVNVNVDQLNLKTKHFELDEGTLFNSNMLAERGISSLPKIKEQFISLLAQTRDFFLPRAQASNGKYINVNQVLQNKTFKSELIKRRLSPKVRTRQELSRFLRSN